jgi:leader peptidase (prepilin peptidase) / N-methyltransferase
MRQLGLVLGMASAGLVVVGPLVDRAVQQWLAWRVTLPILLGYIPERAALGHRPRSLRTGGGVTVVTSLVFAVAAWRIGWSLSLLPVLMLATGMVAASAVDLSCGRIPTRFVYLTAVVVIPAMVAAALLAGQPASMHGAWLGGATYLGLLGTLHVLSPRQLGRGDVRLGGVIGLVVGWLGWTAEQPIAGPLTVVFQAAMAAGLLGLVAGLALRLLRGDNRAYPFGPWLSAGAFVTILVGVSS